MCHNNSGDSACASLIPPDPVSCEWFKNGKRRRAESNIVYSSVGLPAYVNFRVFVVRVLCCFFGFFFFECLFILLTLVEIVFYLRGMIVSTSSIAT